MTSLPQRDLRIPQDCETPVQFVRERAFAFRYAYARSADTIEANDVGQDYLAMRYNEQIFVFALCDGVSQSFYGNIAARLLGEALIDWFWEHIPTNHDEATMSAALNAHLLSLTEPITRVVNQFALPRGLAPMLRDVLEEKRASGSDSTFVCGRIEFPNVDQPQGRIILAWMGDSRLRLWSADGECSAMLGDRFDTAQRWSSRRGPVNGQPNLYLGPLFQDDLPIIHSLVVYSDGLSLLDGKPSLSNFGLQSMIEDSLDSDTSDDISYLELWIGKVPAHIEAKPSPPPKKWPLSPTRAGYS